MMKIKSFIIASSLCFLLLGCGRGCNKSVTLEHCPSLEDNAPPAPSFVLEKITDYDGWKLYERQELTQDSVFYLAVDVERKDTLEQWRAARITKEEVERQALSIQYWIRELWSALHRL